MSTLARLQRWYAAQCNGAWEHQQGVSITSCDNPGWWVKVSLAGTPLDGVAFAEVAVDVDANRHPVGSSWLSCRVEDGVWHGAGDAQKLEVLLETFLSWAESQGSP